MIEAPFSASDFDDGHDWIQRKLLRQRQIPEVASLCILFTDQMENGWWDACRLCPWDALIETAKALGPVANQESVIKFDVASFDNMRDLQNAISIVNVHAMWLVGGILNEMDHREHLSDEQYAKEWDETRQRVKAELEKRLAEIKGEASAHSPKNIGKRSPARPIHQSRREIRP